MRVIELLLALVVTAAVAAAQTSPDDKQPLDVKVLSQKWSNFSYNELSGGSSPFFSSEPFHPTTPTPAAGNPRPMSNTEVTRHTRFIYEARVRNVGKRSIQAIGWDYVLTDRETEEELARHSFHTRGVIRPNREKILRASSFSPPTGSFSAQGVETERVIITCLVYRDGSIWRRAGFMGNCPPVK